MPKATVWKQHGQAKLWRFGEGPAYFFNTSHISVDADGAPDAYHPQDIGRDALANAGYPNNGWRNVLVEDPAHHGHPYVQPTGAHAGYFVSMTALRDNKGASTATSSYVDASQYPYLVLPGGDFINAAGTGGAGDLVMALQVSSGLESFAVIGDVSGAEDELGEISIALAERLGGHDVNPRNGDGAPTGPFIYIVLPRSHHTPRWPLAAATAEHEAKEALDQLGGWQTIRSAMGI